MESNTCPKCGAIYFNDLTCESVFNEFLALEFTNPAYGAVHLLTVSCYMIQHGQYTDEALAWVEQRLDDFLEKGIPIQRIREQAARTVSQDKRDWQVTRREGNPPQMIIPWSMTILDVAKQYHDAESYRKLVEQWARVTVKEMQPLIHKAFSAGAK